MIEFTNLQQQLLTYLSKEQVDEVVKAFQVAKVAHAGQDRNSGEPYITHPVAVATILAEMHLDFQAIMAALLHDVLEDTEVTREELEQQFGKEVVLIVDGVSKLTRIKFKTKIEEQANNLRKMMLAMSNDIRVILVKIADRLHNMRTLAVLSKARQEKISKETLEIYAPIAHRLGMNLVKVEFEELGFHYLYPNKQKVLKAAIEKARGNRARLIDEIIGFLTDKLTEEKADFINIFGREKHLYSLYNKMQQQELSLPEIMDIYAIRIITNDLSSCYSILGIIHSLYKPIPGKFKDYIAVPKSNGYQSLHTIVLGPYGVPVEIQIRTEKMDQMAETGIASHWLYKSSSDNISNAELKARKWLQRLLDIHQQSGNHQEFLDNLKIDLYPDDVYVFTPTGDIWSLPKGSTAVDFAYTVHTDIGNSCIAAKIDRRLVPLSTKLTSGQTIDIITIDGANPNPAWLSFVVTGKARSNIRHWLKNQHDTESRNLGKRLIERSLSTLSLTLDDISSTRFDQFLQEAKIKSKDELFTDIGLGNLLAPIIASKLVSDIPSSKDLSENPLSVKGTEGMLVIYAKCCHPIPNDPIVGYLSSGRGIVIHKEGCVNIPENKKEPEKYIFVKWDQNIKGLFDVDLKVDVINKRGILATVANVISEQLANIVNVKIDERDSRHNSLSFLIQVNNSSHLAKIVMAIKQIDIVTKVVRL